MAFGRQCGVSLFVSRPHVDHPLSSTSYLSQASPSRFHPSGKRCCAIVCTTQMPTRHVRTRSQWPIGPNSGYLHRPRPYWRNWATDVFELRRKSPHTMKFAFVGSCATATNVICVPFCDALQVSIALANRLCEPVSSQPIAAPGVDITVFIVHTTAMRCKER